jgi:hypothetical protein
MNINLMKMVRFAKIITNKKKEVIKMNNNQPINIKTGVLSGNSVECLWDKDYIDLDYDQALEEYIKENPDDENGDNFEYYGDSSCQLYGDWLKDEDQKYYPDPNGEYAAIYDSNDNIIQVVHSKYCMFVSLCSPCYPDQGNLDDYPGEKNIMGDPVWAYCLPGNLMGEEWLKGKKIMEVK